MQLHYAYKTHFFKAFIIQFRRSLHPLFRIVPLHRSDIKNHRFIESRLFENRRTTIAFALCRIYNEKSTRNIRRPSC